SAGRSNSRLKAGRLACVSFRFATRQELIYTKSHRRLRCVYILWEFALRRGQFALRKSGQGAPHMNPFERENQAGHLPSPDLHFGPGRVEAYTLLSKTES